MTAAARQRRCRERRALRSLGFRILKVPVRRETIGALIALRLLPGDVVDDDELLGASVGALLDLVQSRYPDLIAELASRSAVRRDLETGSRIASRVHERICSDEQPPEN